MVAVKFDDLSLAFDFVGSTPPSENNAYISLDTGQIYCTSGLSPLDEEVPDDLETSDRYLLLPHKTELDLGKGLALRFAASELPHCYDRIVGFFRHKRAYARFKDLLDSEGALERWYKYETEATERALRDWCSENDIRIVGDHGDSAAQPVDAPDRLPSGIAPAGKRPVSFNVGPLEDKRMDLPERFRGSLLGLAVGDAVGTTVEFRPRGTFVPVTDIRVAAPSVLRPANGPTTPPWLSVWPRASCNASASMRETRWIATAFGGDRLSALARVSTSAIRWSRHFGDSDKVGSRSPVRKIHTRPGMAAS